MKFRNTSFKFFACLGNINVKKKKTSKKASDSRMAKQYITIKIQERTRERERET